MTPFSIGVILRPNTSRKIRSMGVSRKGLRRAMDPYTTSGQESMTGFVPSPTAAMGRGISHPR
jgi:hypothetical protein